MNIRNAGHSGRFITFEGVEGAGKSTRCRRLTECLENGGFPVVHTREPGGPGVSERIRSILLDPELKVAPLTELMLYLASRASNVDLVIRPALEKGVNVVCERFSDATFAYQIGGRGLPEAPVRNADRLATGGLVPDLVIILDLDPELGFRRLQKQGRERDRIEQEEIGFHRRVRSKYLQLAGEESRRYLVVDASGEPELQDSIIRDRVMALITDIGGEER
ncbi:MAG: dTMP kinase [Candidatus Fermentibacteraceae bacterium]|nr:dTMP kinase [Candidatus Fermentibacteraceae bacterium]MBN2609002.1 dTMP kinase [Candidatus Fermentibacteraceae bacterium]